MRLHYCHTPEGNFGDDLNGWLWPRLAPGLLDDDASTELLGIGTLLNGSVAPGPHHVVFSSGFGYGRAPVVDQSWTVICVRGPLTARALGLDASLAVTDGAALVATLEPERQQSAENIAFMPHHRSLAMADWQGLCHSVGIELIDPRQPVEHVLGAIGSARLLLTEALHGAVVADALRVPWIALAGNSHVYALKWEDWCASLDLPYRPQQLPVWQQTPLSPPTRLSNSFKVAMARAKLGKDKWRRLPCRVHGPARQLEVARRLAHLAAHNPGQLSDQRILSQRLETLQDRLAELRRRFSK